MENQYILTDERLGTLRVRQNARARHIILRPRADGVHITVPPLTSVARIRQAVEQCRTRLEAGLANSRRPLIDLNFRIDAPHFRFELAQGASARFVAVPLPGGLRVQCPPDVPLADDKVQAWLRKVIGEALRVRAKDYLPRRLGQLAAAHGFSYSGVKINSSRTRWGSCSASGQVNLSYSLLLLPDRLIDYVLLHELAHTVELNHGARFWALLDGVCGGKSGQLREELRLHTTDF